MTGKIPVDIRGEGGWGVWAMVLNIHIPGNFVYADALSTFDAGSPATPLPPTNNSDNGNDNYDDNNDNNE